MRGILFLLLFLCPAMIPSASGSDAIPGKPSSGQAAQSVDASDNVPSAFEGAIDMILSMEEGAADLTLRMAGDRARLDMRLTVAPLPEPIRMSVLIDAKTPRTVFLVNDRLKTFSAITQPEAPAASAAGKPALKELGRGKILGYNSVHLTLTSPGESIDAWITPELPDVYRVLKRLQEANPQIGNAGAFRALEAAGKSGMPMRLTVIQDGRKAAMEVKKIERRAQPASLFAVPMDYKRTEFGAGGLQPSPEQIEDLKRIIEGALNPQ